MSNSVQSPLVRARGIERVTKIERVYLKREDCLPSGFHKFRAAKAVCCFAIARGIHQIVAASCGSYATALLHVAQGTNLEIHLFLSATTDSVIPSLSFARSVVRAASYEDAVDRASGFARERGFLDVTPGGVMAGVLRSALGQASIEIVRELRAVPGAIFRPVGNGTTLAGMFERLIVAEPITFPAFYGVGVQDNVLFRSCEQWSPDTKDCRLEPLRAEMPLDGIAVDTAVRLSGGALVAVKLSQIEEAQTLLRDTEGIEVSLPAAAAVAGMIQSVRCRDRFAVRDAVCVITAAG
jgi:threonine synthase